MTVVAFIDTEIDSRTRKVLDIGGIRSDGPSFHNPSPFGFAEFLKGAEYVCGHNIFNHDLKYVGEILSRSGIPEDRVVDTLYLSPLLFPKKPYHKLLKDDKLQVDELNNPQNDSLKARDLFNDEVSAFVRLEERLKTIYWALLKDEKEFKAFFRYVGYTGILPDNPQPVIRGLMSIFRRAGRRYDRETEATGNLIREYFKDAVCANAEIEEMVEKQPVELGIASDSQVEIQSGLKEGDQVISDVSGEVREGMKATGIYKETEGE